MKAALITIAGFALFSPARALPDGADWNAYGGPGGQDCTSCHFDGEPQRDSDALSLEGLPARLAPNEIYQLSIRLHNPHLVTAGFLIRAEMNGVSAGVFEPENDLTEANGAGARSTAKGSRVATDGEARWRFRWSAPVQIDGPVTFYIAANAANDDQSPFGDMIYLTRVIAGDT